MKKLDLPSTAKARVAVDRTEAAKALTPREKEQAAEILSGERSLTETMADEKPHLREAVIEALHNLGVNEHYLGAKLKDGMEAKETKFFAHQGAVTDSRDVIDWRARHAYLRTALDVLGLGSQSTVKRTITQKVQYKSHLQGTAKVIDVSAPKQESVKRRMAAQRPNNRSDI